MEQTYRIMDRRQPPMAYEAPQVEVIEVEVEQGFAVSDFGDGGEL